MIRTAITAGTSRVASGPLCLHAVANTPAGRMEFVRSYDFIRFGLPRNRGGSAPALTVSRPAQRSLTLRPARSPSRLATLYTRGFSSLVASTAALIATGWSEPVPGRVYSRCGPPPFHGAPDNPVYRDLSEKTLQPPLGPALVANSLSRDQEKRMMRKREVQIKNSSQDKFWVKLSTLGHDVQRVGTHTARSRAVLLRFPSLTNSA